MSLLNGFINVIRQQIIFLKLIRQPYIILLAVVFLCAETIISSFGYVSVSYRSICDDFTLNGLVVPVNHERNSLISTQYVAVEPVVIDMISIGSKTREDYQIAQVRTFATHPSVRNFYLINELNDTDASCSTTLTNEQLTSIVTFCNTPSKTRGSAIRDRLLTALKPFHYERISTGWLCAQKRPIDALQLILNQYRHADLETIPDYLVVIDDDTYIHMDLFITALHNHKNNNQINSKQHNHGLHLFSGCMSINPRKLQFYHTHGGFGTIFSKAMIVNLLRPIYCHHEDNRKQQQQQQQHEYTDGFTKMACWRLQQNHFHELQYFQNGMSVSDLMYNYSSSLSFLNHNEWQNGNGFCFHSDHAIAYFSNFYHVTIPDEIINRARLSDRIRHTHIRYGYNTIDTNPQCSNSYYENCKRSDMICHYIQPELMERMYNNNIYYDDEIKANIGTTNVI